MTARYVTTVDAIVTILQTVGSLNTLGPVYHKYAPWNPQEEFANHGETRVGVWPLATATTNQRISTHGRELTTAFAVKVWQDATDSQGRGVADEAADATFLQLHDDIVAKWLGSSNEFTGGADDFMYEATDLTEGSGLVRAFTIVLRERRSQGL